MNGALPHVCVIGAGVSGLTAGKALSDWGIPYTCFEASDDIGGTWYFGNPHGRSAAYRSLHIDISRPSISFRDFPMSDRYPDFPHHAEILDYLHEYATAFDLRRRIRFDSEVEDATPLADGWSIRLSDRGIEHFDALLVCNGHHWDPSWPDPPFPGEFAGPQIHAHSYVDPTDPVELAGKRVLVVGIGNSAVDITSELSRKGVAEKVFISTRSGAWVVPKYFLGRPLDQIAKTIPWIPLAWQRQLTKVIPYLASGRPERFGLPTPDHRFLDAHPTVSSEILLRLGSGDAVAKPNVKELSGDRVGFEDGSVEPIDAIIYATGYRISFPFLDPALFSAPGNRVHLYKSMFAPGLERLAFIGLAQALPTIFSFAECQSKFAARWLAGEWDLPPIEEMEHEIALDLERFTGNYSDRPRHTIQHNFYVYDYELRHEVLPAGRRRAAARRAELAAA